jgi:L-aminopeptidase/D-esterase-like protein
LTKEEVNEFAQLAANGYPYAIRPASMIDGDALFALSTGDVRGDVTALGTSGAEAVAEAIARAVKEARSLCGVAAYGDLQQGKQGS